MKQNGKLAVKSNKQLKDSIGKIKNRFGKAQKAGKLKGAIKSTARQGKQVAAKPESDEEAENEEEMKKVKESEHESEEEQVSVDEDGGSEKEDEQAPVEEEESDEEQLSVDNEGGEDEVNEDNESEEEQVEDDEESEEEQLDVNDNEESEEEQLDVNDDEADDKETENDAQQEADDDEEEEDNDEVQNEIDENASDSDAPEEQKTVKQEGRASNDSESDSDAPEESRIKHHNEEFNFRSIPSTIPDEKIIAVTKLTVSPTLRQELSAHFSCCGTITNLKILKTKKSVRAFIAFATAEEAQAAIDKFHGTTFKDATIHVYHKRPKVEKTETEPKPKKIDEFKVKASNLPFDVQTDELRRLFNNCGQIAKVQINRNFRNNCSAHVTFRLKASVDEAIKISGKEIRKQAVLVERLKEQTLPFEDPKRSVVLQNSEPPLRALQWHQLKEIFLKIGRIVNYVIVGHPKCSAIVTYESEKAAQKALKLNNTRSEEGIHIKAVPYTGEEYKHAILVENLPDDVTENDLRAHFKSAGTITEILRGPGGTVLKFSNRNEFCLAFMENESLVKGKPIYLQPFTVGKLTYANQQSFLLRKYLEMEKRKKRQQQMRRKYSLNPPQLENAKPQAIKKPKLNSLKRPKLENEKSEAIKKPKLHSSKGPHLENSQQQAIKKPKSKMGE